MSEETLCCIFKSNISKKEDFPKKQFEVVKDYGDVGGPNDCSRALLKCSLCGKLFLYQFLEYEAGGEDYYYHTYIQVESEVQADELNAKTNWVTIDKYSPAIRINAGGTAVFYK